MIKNPVIKPVVVDFLRNNRDLPNLTAAKKLFSKYPDMFENVEHARMHVRYVRGSAGRRPGVALQDLVRSPEEINSWKDRMPQPSDEGFRVHYLPKEVKKWLFMADGHSPYYAVKEFSLALEYGRDQGCDGIGYLGDWTDMYMLSMFCKDPRMRSIKDEADILKELFDIANDVIQPKSVVWKLGNHEARLEKHVMVRTPELLGLPGLEMKAIFGTDERGIKIVPETDPLKHKSLTLIHGHEYKGGFIAPVNPARGMFLRANDSVVSAHQHKTSEHTEQTINEKIITCWSLGCLCALHPKYAPFNKWNHGFGILETGQGDIWKFHNKRIIKGVVV